MRAVDSRYFQKGNIKLQLLHCIPFTRLLLGSSGNPLENPTSGTFIDNHVPAFERQTAPTCHQCPPRQCPDRVPREHTSSTVEGEGRGRRVGSSQSDGEGLDLMPPSWAVPSPFSADGSRTHGVNAPWVGSGHQAAPELRRKGACPDNSFCTASGRSATVPCWNVPVRRYRFFLIELLLCCWGIKESRGAGWREGSAF